MEQLAQQQQFVPYVSMGPVQSQQAIGQVQSIAPTIQGQTSVAGISPQVNAFQFPQLLLQQQK